MITFLILLNGILSDIATCTLYFSDYICTILPPLHNRTHKTTLGGMSVSVSQAHETLHCCSNSKNKPQPDTITRKNQLLEK